jgi:hypothetical protein
LLKLRQKALAVGEQEVRVVQQPVGKDAEHQAVVDKEAGAAEDKISVFGKVKQ